MPFYKGLRRLHNFNVVLQLEAINFARNIFSPFCLSDLY
jgi:hypothetical protein